MVEHAVPAALVVGMHPEPEHLGKDTVYFARRAAACGRASVGNGTWPRWRRCARRASSGRSCCSSRLGSRSPRAQGLPGRLRRPGAPDRVCVEFRDYTWMTEADRAETPSFLTARQLPYVRGHAAAIPQLDPAGASRHRRDYAQTNAQQLADLLSLDA